MFDTITETRNYNECIKYINDLEHFYVGAKLSPHKSERIKQTLQRFCDERHYNKVSNDASCSSDNNFGGTTLNTMIRSPVDPSLVNPFPLIIFSSRF
jgi:hypothetical protein